MLIVIKVSKEASPIGLSIHFKYERGISKWFVFDVNKVHPKILLTKITGIKCSDLDEGNL